MYTPTKTRVDNTQLFKILQRTGKLVNIYIDDYTVDSTNSSQFRIEFENCEIRSIFIKEPNRLESLVFRNCLYVGNVHILNLPNNCSVEIINDNQYPIQSLRIIDSKIAKIEIYNAFFNTIELKSTLVPANAFDLFIRDSRIDEFFRIENQSLLGLRVFSSEIKSLQVTGGKLRSLSLESTSGHDVEIESNVDTINFLDSNFTNQLKVVPQGRYIHTFKIRCATLGKCKGKLLEIMSLASDNVTISNFYITGMILETLDLSKIQRIDELRLHNSVIRQELNICGVGLGYCEFNILDIKHASLKIHRTEFNDLNLKNVEWSTQNRAYEFNDRSLRNNKAKLIFELKNLKESYRELKIHFLRNHSFFDAMLFATNELRIQRRIKHLETWRWPISHVWHNFGDWFVLSTNQWFSNFGLSWTRPLLWWLFVFHMVPFYFILLHFDLGIDPVFDLARLHWNGIEGSSTYEAFKVYLSLLFPVHSTQVTTTVHGMSYSDNIWGVLDFTMRVFSSYFIFLIIRGTRKFNFKIG